MSKMGLDLKFMEFRYDEGRLQRSYDIVILSIDTDGEQLPAGHYVAVGGSPQPHYCQTEPYIDCDCEDFAWGTDRLCKHLIAALRYEENELIAKADVSVGNLKPVVLEVTLVCGPPASGKSTYVANHAQRGDLVWDLDAVVRCLTHGLGPHEISITTREIVRKVRATVLEEVAKAKRNPRNELERAWIIWSLPKAHVRRALANKLGAKVVVFEVSAEDCVINAELDIARDEPFVARVRRDAQKWWELYSRHDGDEVYENSVPE